MFSYEIKNKVMQIWNNYFKYDPVNISNLDKNYFNNSYILPLEPIINDDAYSLIGIRGKKFFYEPYDMSSAWIMSAAYNKKESLIKLLNNQIKVLKNMGINTIYYSNFSPGYFFPGIDKDRYPEIYQILLDYGFKLIEKALGMDACIGNLLIEYNDCKLINNLKPDDTNELLNVIMRNFPADCYYRALSVINKGQLDQITIAKIDNKIIGYAMYSNGYGDFDFAPGERFGCFEVIEPFRSRGIGSKLLLKTLIKMKSNGIKHAYLLWGNEKVSKLYMKYGFKTTRQFYIMKLELNNY